MVSRIALALLLSGMPVRAGIDFTPTPVFVQFESVRVEQPGFKDGNGGLVTFEPPSGWALDGAGPLLKLTPKDATYASARVETRALPAGVVDSEDNLKFGRDYFTRLLPAGAVDLKWDVEVEKNPVLLNRHESVRLTGSYMAQAQEFKVAVILCSLADQQLVFVLSSRERDFAKLYADWRRSLFTWQGLK